MINVVFSNFLPDAMVICFPVKTTGKIIANNGEKKNKNAAAKVTQKEKLTTSGYERYSRNLKIPRYEIPTEIARKNITPKNAITRCLRGYIVFTCHLHCTKTNHGHNELPFQASILTGCHYTEDILFLPELLGKKLNT